jgi:hypothetical protein
MPNTHFLGKGFFKPGDDFPFGNMAGPDNLCNGLYFRSTQGRP